MADQNEQKLKTLIQGSIFLEEDLKIQLLQNLDKLSNQNIQELESAFEQSHQQQDNLFNKMLTYDPTFLPRLKDFKRSKIRGFQKQLETKERTQEKAEDILNQI